jgi:hypothetical protein
MLIDELKVELERRTRNATLEEAAQVVLRGQETHTSTVDGDEYTLSPRRHGNLAGLVYAKAIRALKR